MKEYKNKIREEVEKTMSSLDRMERLKGNPWLYTQIQQTISEKEKQGAPGLFSFGKLQPLFVAVLLLVNVWTAYTVFNNSSTDEKYFEALAEEYTSSDDQLINYYIED